MSDILTGIVKGLSGFMPKNVPAVKPRNRRMLVRTVGHILPKEASSVRSAARSWNVPKLPPSVSARIAVMRFRADIASVRSVEQRLNNV